MVVKRLRKSFFRFSLIHPKLGCMLYLSLLEGLKGEISFYSNPKQNRSENLTRFLVVTS
jgi:hypothetical protein